MQSQRTSRLQWLAAAVIAALLFAPARAQTTEPVAGVANVIKDFRNQSPTDPSAAISPWNWSEENKKAARTFSEKQVVELDGSRAMRLMVTDRLPWGDLESFKVMPIGPDLLPPTADAVAIRIRVLEGKMILSVGGPTIYFGHSDVQSEPVTLDARDGTAWRNVTFSLNDRLIRNFRRAGFAKDSPVIYYTRWIQEPLSLYVHQGSAGTVLIERVELRSLGRGRPAPRFEPADVKVVSPILDLAAADSMRQVFTATLEDVDFTGAARSARTRWKPPVPSHVADAGDGHRGVLSVEHQGAEEVTFTGIKIAGEAGANAVAIDIRASSPLPLKELSVEWMIYASVPGAPLDLNRFRAPSTWRGDQDKRFDFYLGERAMRAESFAFFHSRRALPNGEWTRLILPLADFVCVYGGQKAAQTMLRQEPINPANAVAIGWLPSFRQSAAPTRFEIDRIEWVHVPGDATTLRSFSQVDAESVRLIPRGDQAGRLKQMVPASR